MKNHLVLIFLFLITSMLGAQSSGIVSGPMLGPVELRDAIIWLEVTPEVKSISLQYRKANTSSYKTKMYKGELGNEFNPIQMQIGALDYNTAYEYQFLINSKLSNAKGTFKTKDLWQWRKPAPDFSFLVGSCHYGNEPVYDRPGKPYGGDPVIFQTMAKENAAFMLWTGDAWYSREVDYYSKWGLWYRAQYARKMPEIQPFLKSMPQWAMWDDHDYGPNDIGTNFILKDETRKIFMSYFCNPSYGENGQGAYTINSWGDVDIFMLDDRWWRSADELIDSIDGRPNPDKVMLGRQQMLWLKNSLAYSNATFKLIMVGSQVLNPVSPFDKLLDFKLEYDELMKFLMDQKVNGVLFLTGDRHHSEIIKVERPGSYPLYDITISPLTSGTHTFSGTEKNNPYRVVGVDQKQNFGRVSVSGKENARILKVEIVGMLGEVLATWQVSENELKN
ncbi:MAG: alkaline phosphatase family protein [Saprospiraceae bacterium]|jgi:alkaline phosphatase D|nr:alkaline phosphatase family protein [Saprospiraceae bacterium]MBK7373051.1 alkaline phosphatase family protein [Saprospiraceae bacterium]MBK9681610.1 alkaline phosphatase family protein [Saprospiraceae bacterium]MBK9928553.1 alkaline phosphatase family protein [Saprospiraceae bacterium]